MMLDQIPHSNHKAILRVHAMHSLNTMRHTTFPYAGFVQMRCVSL